MIILETERLLLRQFHIFDGEALECVFGDPEVMYFGPGIQTRSWIHHWLHGCLENYQKLGFGPWAVVENAGRTVIGYAGLFHFPEIDGQPEIEIGYRLARRCWGQGFATEAAAAIRDYAFNVLCLPRLIALIDPQNTALNSRGGKSWHALREGSDARGVYSSRLSLFHEEPDSHKKSRDRSKTVDRREE